MSAEQTRILLNLDEVKVDPLCALRVPGRLAVRRRMLPFATVDGHVHVACADENDASAVQAIRRFVSLPIRLEPAEPQSLMRALKRVYGEQPAAARPSRHTTRGGSIDARSTSIDVDMDDPVAICEEMFHAAAMRQASDVHIDPERDGVQVRMRVDGVLEKYRVLPAELHAGVVGRIKVLSGMNISEKRAPQDGHIAYQIAATGEQIDVRTATLPTRYGERVTIRLMGGQSVHLTLEKLGMCREHLDVFHACLDKPHGMILMTGPTGSGKSTSLYAAIRRLISRSELNIITIEDPVECEIPDVAQVKVDATDRLSFAKVLRSVLRHDPDVVMIGEIRDLETVDVAVKASLTGHLVLSTLHTNSAASAITRMCDMGVERFLIAATVKLAVAQRLVRRLCQRCRKPRPLTSGEAALLGIPQFIGEIVYDAGGCMYCAGRGHAGRLGLFEMLAVDESWAKLIGRGAEEAELVEKMREMGVKTLVDDAAEKMLAGLTSVEEVISAVSVW